jgi:hypothetical protein
MKEKRKRIPLVAVWADMAWIINNISLQNGTAYFKIGGSILSYEWKITSSYKQMD